MMNKILIIGVNIISVLFTVFLIIYISYCKIVPNTQKVDIDLHNFDGNMDLFETLLFFSLLLTVGYFIILFVKINSKSTGFFTQHFIKVYLLVKKYDPFYHGYSIIFNKIDPMYLRHLVRFTKYLLEFGDKKNKIIIFLGVSLPRIIILCVLLFDIFFMQKLHYYFIALILLIIPVIFRFLVFIFKDLSKKLLPEFKKYLNIGKPEPYYGNLNFDKPETFKDNANSREKPQFETIPFTLKPEYENEMTLTNLLFNFYYPMLFLEGHMSGIILPLYSKISCYTKLIYYSVQSCCWLYILITI